MKNWKIYPVALLLLTGAVGCSSTQGISQEEYDKVVAERDEYKEKYEEAIKIEKETEQQTLALDSEEETSDESVDSKEASTEDIETIADYKHENSIGHTIVHRIVKNNSDETIDIYAKATFKDEGGNVVGISNNDLDALPPDTESIISFYYDGDETVTDYDIDYEIESAWSKPVLQNLKCEVSPTSSKAIITVKNEGDVNAEFVEAHALFFKDGELVNSKTTYITDKDHLIKAGKSVTEEIDSYSEFDDLKVYLTGRGE